MAFSIDYDCTNKCKSKNHSREMINAVTKATTDQFKSYFLKCHNGAKLSDKMGCTVLHMAASCGKSEIVEWLLTEYKMEVNQRDRESAWTALHRAMFYGNISTVRVLTCHPNVKLYSLDNEGLSPLDIAMKDRLPYVSFSNQDPCEAYSWGDNSNYTLGHSVEHRWQNPELIEIFRKMRIFIKQVIIKKYHSVFLTSDGQIYTCGHGHGGRLGHGDEHAVLAPKLVKGLKQEKCGLLAAGRDHTVVLTEQGCVFSFGLNNYHQLGIVPADKTIPDKSLVPRVTIFIYSQSKF